MCRAWVSSLLSSWADDWQLSLMDGLVAKAGLERAAGDQILLSWTFGMHSVLLMLRDLHAGVLSYQVGVGP